MHSSYVRPTNVGTRKKGRWGLGGRKYFQESKQKDKDESPDWRQRLTWGSPYYKKPTSYQEHWDWYDYKTPEPTIFQIVSRNSWGAVEPTEIQFLKKPIQNVLVFHTRSPPCYTTSECRQATQNLQETYLKLGLPDIPYNFLIGTDGTVYEGRGWGVNPTKVHKKYKYRQFDGKSLDIAFIGPYFKEIKVERDWWPKKSFTVPMNQTLVLLVKYGLEHEGISKDFSLFKEV